MKATDLSLHDYLFLWKECSYFCPASSRNLEVLQTFDYFYNWLTKFLVFKLMREPYDFIHHLQGFRNGLDSFRILNLFVYVFIAWYIHNLASWDFMFFNDFFSNFLTPGNTARIYCWHRGSNSLVKIHVIIWVNVTSKCLRNSMLSLVTKTTLTKTVGDCLIRDFFPGSFDPRNRFLCMNFLNNFRGFSIIINPGNDKFQKSFPVFNLEISYYTCM